MPEVSQVLRHDWLNTGNCDIVDTNSDRCRTNALSAAFFIDFFLARSLLTKIDLCHLVGYENVSRSGTPVSPFFLFRLPLLSLVSCVAFSTTRNFAGEVLHNSKASSQAIGVIHCHGYPLWQMVSKEKYRSSLCEHVSRVKREDWAPTHWGVPAVTAKLTMPAASTECTLLKVKHAAPRENHNTFGENLRTHGRCESVDTAKDATLY